MEQSEISLRSVQQPGRNQKSTTDTAKQSHNQKLTTDDADKH